MGETESTRYAWVRELDTQSEDAEVKLIAFLGDPSWRVRQEAVNAIGKYGVTQSLVERAADSGDGIRTFSWFKECSL